MARCRDWSPSVRIDRFHRRRPRDWPYPRRTGARYQLPKADGRTTDRGRTGEHRFAGGGWTTYRIDPTGGSDHALRLLRLSYCYTVLMRRRPTGAAILAETGLEAELDRLDREPDLRATFDRMRE
ncbi:hypothetical protein [Halalkalicoccus subterraneus]